MRTGDMITHPSSDTVMEIQNIEGDKITLKILDGRPGWQDKIITRSLHKIEQHIRDGYMSAYRYKKKSPYSMSPVPFIRKKEIEVINVELEEPDNTPFPW
jgi:hypothetical protein